MIPRHECSPPRNDSLQPSPSRVWARVNIDFHVAVHGHFYSAPSTLVHAPVRVLVDQTTVTIFHRGLRIARHRRSSQPGGYTTDPAHRPPEMKAFAWRPARLIRWAGSIGPMTARLVAAMVASQACPERAYRSCLGLLRLGLQYAPHEMEAACRQALRRRDASYKCVELLLCAGPQKRGVSTHLRQKAVA